MRHRGIVVVLTVRYNCHKSLVSALRWYWYRTRRFCYEFIVVVHFIVFSCVMCCDFKTSRLRLIDRDWLIQSANDWWLRLIVRNWLIVVVSKTLTVLENEWLAFKFRSFILNLFPRKRSFGIYVILTFYFKISNYFQRIPTIMSNKLRRSWSIYGKGTCCGFVSCYFLLLVARGSLPSAQGCETASKIGTPTGMWTT